MPLKLMISERGSYDHFDISNTKAGFPGLTLKTWGALVVVCLAVPRSPFLKTKTINVFYTVSMELDKLRTRAPCLHHVNQLSRKPFGRAWGIYAGEICYRITDLSFSSQPRPFKCFLSKCSRMGYTPTNESIDLDQASDLLIDLLGSSSRQRQPMILTHRAFKAPNSCGELNQRNQPPPYLFRFRLDYRGVDEISKVETNVKSFN